MIDSIINAKNIKEADVVLVSAPYEKTTSSKKGTINGPKQIIKMLSSKLELFDRKSKLEPTTKIKIAQTELKNISLLSAEKAIKKISEKCSEILLQNKFVFLLGGEHSVSLGHLQALSKQIDPKEVTVLQIDAHCDLRDDDSDYSPKSTNLAHSCVLRRVHELGYNLVQVGIRTYSRHEYEYFSNPKNNIKVFEWGNGQKIPTISEIIKEIKTKYVYITIDVDGFDPSFMPATGTPVQGGLEWWYGVELLEQVVLEKKVVGADIVEVSPVKDSVLTEYGSAQLIYNIISNLLLK